MELRTGNAFFETSHDATPSSTTASDQLQSLVLEYGQPTILTCFARLFRLLLRFAPSGLSMKVSVYNGLKVVVLVGEQEHCPPHVHVQHDGWDARFVFSFLHGEVELWAFDPSDKLPPGSLMEKLRQHIEIPGNLKKAREIWLNAHGAGKLGICLHNKYWDPVNLIEVDGSNANRSMYQIQKAVFDSLTCLTTLTFIGGQQPMGIQL